MFNDAEKVDNQDDSKQLLFTCLHVYMFTYNYTTGAEDLKGITAEAQHVMVMLTFYYLTNFFVVFLLLLFSFFCSSLA